MKVIAHFLFWQYEIQKRIALGQDCFSSNPVESFSCILVAQLDWKVHEIREGCKRVVVS